MATHATKTTKRGKSKDRLSAKSAAVSSTLIPTPTSRVPGEPVLIGTSTLTGLHKATGLTLSYLSRVFRGRKVPTVGTLNTIAAAAGITPGTLLDALNGLEKPKGVKGAKKGKAQRTTRSGGKVRKAVKTKTKKTPAKTGGPKRPVRVPKAPKRAKAPKVKTPTAEVQPELGGLDS